MRIKNKRSKPRRGPLRDPAYRAWLQEQRCAVWCHTPHFYVFCGGQIDAAHTQNNGMASKGPDSSCLPLCRKHHQEQHRIGMAAFNRKWNINCAELAKQYWEAYQREQA